ncbi:MAG TPA: hypothetical protein VFV50_09680, partial [Bdellovibrionales bacterium]|nr:hypothetical protein [Bdellovibrionales bacterium]
MNLRPLILLITMLFAPAFALAQGNPDYRPDGTISVCEEAPAAATFDGCGALKGVGWPDGDGQLRRVPDTPPRRIPLGRGRVQEWIKVRFDYFAPTYPGCESAANLKIGGASINEALSNGADPEALRRELGANGKCIRSGYGWVESDRIRPFVIRAKRPDGRKTPTAPKDDGKCYEHIPELNALRGLTNEILDSNMTAVDLILPHVGKCVMTPQQFASKDWGSERYSVYDSVFTDFWNRQPKPKIVLPSGYEMTKEDLRAIDGLARTLMGEAEGCQYQTGRQDFDPGHFETIGRIMVDRGTGIREGDADSIRDFANPKHRDWHELEQVISRSNQFNNWDSIKERWVTQKDRATGKKRRVRIVEDNGALLNTLCPKNDLTAEAHRGKGGRLDPDNQELWKWAVEVATQMYASGGRRYQEVYPWNTGGRARPYDRIGYYTHGVDRDCSYIRIDTAGVRDFKMEFPGGACPQLKLWRPASNVERNACNEAQNSKPPKPRPMTLASATPPRGQSAMIPGRAPARATASASRLAPSQRPANPKPAVQAPANPRPA